jgi:hypothetical protein
MMGDYMNSINLSKLQESLHRPAKRKNDAPDTSFPHTDLFVKLVA